MALVTQNKAAGQKKEGLALDTAPLCPFSSVFASVDLEVILSAVHFVGGGF